MNTHNPIRPGASLLERASEKYDFASALRRAADAAPQAARQQVWSEPAAPAATPEIRAPRPGRNAVVNRERLSENGFVLPDMRPGPLAEEFRVIKRQLLLRAAGQGGAPVENGRMILVSSAKPDDGKTFCAVNLALSMAREPDLDVVLADCDFSKPDILNLFGVSAEAGLMDALAGRADIESCVIDTDIPNLSLLPPGRHEDNATELLASQRTREVFGRLLSQSPTRIVICDSAPALSASPASVLALNAGQTVLVIKADHTSEAELSETLGLLDGCDAIQLLLNAVTFAPHGQRFGEYYGYGE